MGHFNVLGSAWPEIDALEHDGLSRRLRDPCVVLHRVASAEALLMLSAEDQTTRRRTNPLDDGIDLAQSDTKV